MKSTSADESVVPMNPSTTDRLLQAGAVLLADGAGTVSKAVVQEVRSYTHRLLGQRVVAKLTAVDVGAASDVTMDFLGFNEPVSSGPIGVALHAALGFPESALIADPKNARYALGVVKDLNRLARMARSRAGAAKEGMETLGATLGKSVPQFLPSFYEQCGRIFVANDNLTYGGAMFVKARTAEATYGLRVDEEQRRSAFLEFAFAGALPAKALDEYAKSLAAAYPADEAFAHFQSLALQRTRGGLAPWAQLMDVLKRMAKAASVDVESAQREMLGALFGSPSLRFASHTFWKSIRSIAVSMASTDATIRGALLNLHPSGDFATWWMELLNDSGAARALLQPDADLDEAERAIGGRGAWLNRFLDDHGTKPEGTHELIRNMAPQLVAEGATIQFHHWRVGVDVIDLALELGITCAPPHRSWFTYSFDEAKRPLQFLGASTALKPVVVKSVRSAIEDNHAHYVFDREGLRPFLIEWLEERIEAICPRNNEAGQGAFDFTHGVRQLVDSATPSMLDLVPDARERLAAADAMNALRRQLIAGLFDEYTWPALEHALVRFQTPQTGQPARNKRSDEITIDEAWPNAIVHDSNRAIVVDHDAIILEHDLRWANDVWDRRLLFVDGSLFVSWHEWSTSAVGYWTHDANNMIENDSMVFSYGPSEFPSIPVAGGGFTNGARVFNRGDAVCPPPRQVLSDGRNYWVVENSYDSGEWETTCTEFDPATGSRGRQSYPRFIEEHLLSGVKPASMQVLPASEGLQASPLGVHEGLLGFIRFETVTTGAAEEPAPTDLVRIDGVRTNVAHQSSVGIPQTVIDWPHTGERYVVSENGQIRTHTTSTLIAPEPKWFGHSVGVPTMFWHHFSVRDQQGSQALRLTSLKQASDILAKTVELMDASTPIAPYLPAVEQPELSETVRRVIGVQQPLLVSSIGHAAGVVALAKRELDQWLSGKAPGKNGLGFIAVADEQEEPITIGALAITHSSYSMSLLTQLRTLKSFVQLPPGTVFGELEYAVERSLVSNGPSPASLMDGTPALVYRLLLDSTPAAEREALLVYLDEWLDHPISQHNSLTFGKYRIECEDDPEGSMIWGSDGTPWWIHRSEMDPDNDDNDDLYEVDAVAFRADATPPPGYAKVKTWSVEPYVATQRVRELLGLIRENGPMAPMTADAATYFANRTGSSRAFAAVVLSGLCGVGYRSRDFDKAQRDLFGVKAGDVKSAITALDADDLTNRQKALIAACYPERLETLWERPTDFADAVAQGWVATYGEQSAIPDELLSALTKTLSDKYYAPSPRVLLSDLDGSAPQFADAVNIAFDDDGDISMSAAVVSPSWIEGTIRTMAMLAHDLPVGDPWRRNAASGVVSLLRKLDHPSLAIPWSETETAATSIKDLVSGLAVMPSSKKIRVYDAGDMIVVNADSWDNKPTVWKFYLRPSMFDSPSPTRQVADGFVEPSSSCSSLLGWLYSDRSLGFLKGILESPMTEGDFTQNPLASMPNLVAAVSAELAVSEESAALYLQLLALAEPTTANIRSWNGWTAKQLTTASAPLIDKGLLLSAKRAGAGRDIFLPGGWIEMRSPAIGIEDWKAPFYALTNEAAAKRSSLLGRVLPLDPIPTLFAQAWERWTNGDRPGFQSAGPGLGERKKKGK
jgi:hypothetical protein